MIWVALGVVTLTLGAAIAVMLLENLLAAVAAASVVSLGVSITFVLLRAPDVAMTEAAVGGGLSSLFLALALRRLGLIRLDVSEKGNDGDA
jgi:energy-converting hydrogenase B subunit D